MHHGISLNVNMFETKKISVIKFWSLIDDVWVHFSSAHNSVSDLSHIYASMKLQIGKILKDTNPAPIGPLPFREPAAHRKKDDLAQE